MESLEVVLRRVNDLRSDLSAEIVVQEGEGHEEHFQTPFPESTSDKGMRDFLDGYDEWIVDKPKIAYPDVQKRELSRAKLQQIYAFSEWYSARYVAGQALGISNNQLLKQKEKWLIKISEELCLPNKERVYAGEKVVGELPNQYGNYNNMEDVTESIYMLQINENNMARKIHAKEDLKSLGYNRLILWGHLHPVASIIIGVSFACAASGLIYGVFKYFNK